MIGNTYIIEGHLDRVLLRPLSSLFQVLLEKVRIESLIGLVIGVVVIALASKEIGLTWTLGKLLLLVGMVFCGLLIYAGVFITLASVSFWWPDRMGLLPPVYNMIAFGKYPVTIYNPLIPRLRIPHLHQDKSLCRKGGTCLASIFRFENTGNPFRL